MAELIPIPSDRDLVEATRAGDNAAWAELVARHHPAVTRVARVPRSSGAAKRADLALAQVREDIVRGDVEADASTSELPQIRDVRCRALAALTGGTVGPAQPPPGHRNDDVRRTETPDRHDLIALADAFLQAPWAWQTAVWLGRAEGRAASEISPMLGRSANDVSATVQLAESGLFELYLRADAARIGDLDATSAALLPLLGGHRRGVLSPNDRRRVDDLLARQADGSPDGIHARRWMTVGATLDTLLPQALVPGLVGQSVDHFWAVLGVAGAAVGTAELAAARSERVRQSARIGAVAAIVVAILGAAFLIRNPFDGLNASLISELIVGDAATGSDDENADGQGGGTDGVGDGASGQNGGGLGDPSAGDLGPDDQPEVGPGDGSAGGGPGGNAGEPGEGGGGPDGGGSGVPGEGGGGAGSPGGGGTGEPGEGGGGGGGTGGPEGGGGTPGTGGPEGGGGTPGTGGPEGGGGTGGPGTGGPGTGGPGTGGPGTGGPGTGGGVDVLDDRIDLVFPGARQGIIYVPGHELLQLSAVLDARSDFVAGGTGRVGLAITNNDHAAAQASFEIRSTEGIRLVSGGGAGASCRARTSRPSSCSFSVGPGDTIALVLVFGLDADLTGELEIVPSIPGAALYVPIV